MRLDGNDGRLWTVVEGGEVLDTVAWVDDATNEICEYVYPLEYDCAAGATRSITRKVPAIRIDVEALRIEVFAKPPPVIPLSK